VAIPPDGPSANWSYGPTHPRDEGAPAPYGFRSAQGAPGGPPAHRRPGLPQPPEPLPYEGPAPYTQPRPRIQTVDGLASPEEAAPAPSSDHPLVRPYTMTGGRTRPRYQLAIEALVSTSVPAHEVQGRLPEHQRICQLCQEIKSIAEISALLTVPLGVVRILVADLAEAGLVAIHQPSGGESAGGQPNVTLLERVLSGLRKL
jgi:hypothetical protein